MEKEPSAKRFIIAILVSFALIFFILYGLVPGFIKAAGWAELLFVNVFEHLITQVLLHTSFGYCINMLGIV